MIYIEQFHLSNLPFIPPTFSLFWQGHYRQNELISIDYEPTIC